MLDVRLRPLIESDLPILFVNEQDETARQMAAFTSKDPFDWDAFNAHWNKLLADESITIRTIEVGGAVAGSISQHSWFGDPEVSYWIGREHWGKGIATSALTQFLTIIPTRPLYARVAYDNIASICVLEKCGFTAIGTDRGFANACGIDLRELIMILDNSLKSHDILL